MNWQGYFKDKKITVMRVGLLGRGVGDAAFLAEQGAEVMVVDDAEQSVMQPSVDALRKYSNIQFKFGPYDPQDFINADFVLKGAGAKQEEPALMAARKAGVPIKMSASWFQKIAGIPCVGVTGTRGKSTVTMMLYDIMRAAGMEVLLGGNVRGVSTLALLPHVTKSSVALMELDSWQCRGFGDEQSSPNVAVCTTFMDDHLNYYKGDRMRYLDDKAQIFLYQKPEDTLIVSEQALPAIEKYKSKIRSHVQVAKSHGLELSVLGAHNQLNASCALEAARALGIDDNIALKALKDFKGVPGRLELVRERNGVKFYNDTTATTPDATLAALEALGTEKTILIMGGADKGLDMSKLEARLPELKKVVRIEQGLEEALHEALTAAQSGDIVLFSPAYASFGMFKNEFDRGDQYNELVRKL